MKDQLISFETANLAKEKGFDIACKNSYYSEGKYLNSEDDCEGELFSNGPLYTVAPTQSLLQKWLRTQLFHIVINPSFGFVICEIKDISGGRVIDKNLLSQNGFSSYEDALEMSLQETLKLIK